MNIKKKRLFFHFETYSDTQGLTKQFLHPGKTFDGTFTTLTPIKTNIFSYLILINCTKIPKTSQMGHRKFSIPKKLKPK